MTITQRSVDDIDRAVAFARDLVVLRGWRAKAAMHSSRFVRRYAKKLSPLQLTSAVASVALTCLPTVASSPSSLRIRRPRQTFYAPTEHIDSIYEPVMPVRPDLQRYFRPTSVTDENGKIAEDVVADLEPSTAPPARNAA